MSVSETVLDLAKRAKAASRGLAQLSTDEKNRCLLAMAEAFKVGNLGVMDYYKFQNIQADTDMRGSIAKPGKGPGGSK